MPFLFYQNEILLISAYFSFPMQFSIAVQRYNDWEESLIPVLRII